MMWIDYMDNTDGVPYKLVHKWKVALPLHAEWGTVPNVYYIPPMSPPRLKWEGNVLELEDGNEPRLPREYLRSLFGAQVDQALGTLAQEMETQRSGGRSELMWLMIATRSSQFMGPFPKDPSEVKQG
jgi:ethylbenzene hydroxylase subunit beta/complex iron-sulfur molybdoenzyme family reductase subunit beta